MKIGIDISQIVYKGTGVARYTQGLVESILKFDQKNKWVFFFSGWRRKLPKKIKEQILTSRHHLITKKIPPTLLGFLWNDLHWLPIDNFISQLDWFITSDWTEPPTRQIKKATIVHDLAFKRYPETVAKKVLHYQKKRLNWIKKESKIIFADSQSTKKDLIKFYQIDPQKIAVAYPGLNKISDEPLKPGSVSNQEPFLLTVGKIEPRKNLSRLFNAYLKLNPPIKLYIVGQKGWGKITTKNNPKIKFLGNVSDRELKWLYKNCSAFIYPSIWEGFGYPLLEAMSYGKPIASSNSSSLKEIGQEAVLFFNPLNEEEIKLRINQVLNNKKLREKLSRHGRQRSRQFNWKDTIKIIINRLAKN